jgi:uncharacterized protein YndB with AHSA1/START domain
MSTIRPTTITAHPGSPFLESVRDFDAARRQVFRAFTEPDLVVRWLGPRDIAMRLIEYDVRTGGGYHYVHRGADGREHRFRGVYHTVRDSEQIIQTFEWEGAPDQVSLEYVTFEDSGGMTRLRTRAVFPSVQARDAAMANGMERGITDSMDRLGELIADTEASGAGSTHGGSKTWAR